MNSIKRNGEYLNVETKRWQTKPYEFDGLTNKDLRKADLSDTSLLDIDFAGSDFRKANLTRANMVACDFGDCDLRKASLKSGYFKSCSFVGSKMNRAYIAYSNFRNSNFIDAKLNRAGLLYSDFSNCFFSGADLREARLERANFYGANLKDTCLDGANLRYTACGNNKELFTFQLPPYQVVVWGQVMAVGCQQHTIERWLSFSDGDVEMMDYNRSNDFLLDYYHNKLLPLLEVIRG